MKIVGQIRPKTLDENGITRYALRGITQYEMRVITFKLSDQEIKSFEATARKRKLTRSGLLHWIIANLDIAVQAIKQENSKQ